MLIALNMKMKRTCAERELALNMHGFAGSSCLVLGCNNGEAVDCKESRSVAA